MRLGAGVAHSVQCLSTDWTTGVRSPEEAKDFSSNPCVQTSSESHPASYPLSTGVNRGRGMTLTTHPYLLPSSRMSRSYTSSLAPAWRVAGQLFCEKEIEELLWALLHEVPFISCVRTAKVVFSCVRSYYVLYQSTVAGFRIHFMRWWSLFYAKLELICVTYNKSSSSCKSRQFYSNATRGRKRHCYLWSR
jgi:hypothetical protein